MSSITRLGPPENYLSDAIFDQLGIAQSVSAAGTVHISGVIAMELNETGLAVVAPGNITLQLAYILDALERCLAQHGLEAEHLISITVFVTDMGAFAANAGAFNERLSVVRPASTVVEVRALGHPDALVEISAVAIDPSL